MLVETRWDNEEKTIVRYTYKKGWGYGDVSNAMRDASVLINSVEHEVNVLMDFTEASILPQGALSYTHRYFRNPVPTNMGVTYIVGKYMFLRVIYDAANKVWGKQEQPWKLIFVNTEAEAYQAIQARQTEKSS